MCPLPWQRMTLDADIATRPKSIGTKHRREEAINAVTLWHIGLILTPAAPARSTQSAEMAAVRNG